MEKKIQREKRGKKHGSKSDPVVEDERKDSN